MKTNNLLIAYTCSLYEVYIKIIIVIKHIDTYVFIIQRIHNKTSCIAIIVHTCRYINNLNN